MQIFGTGGRIEVDIPFNAPSDRPCRIFIDDGSELGGASAMAETFAICDQYTLQGTLFSECVRTGKAPEFPLEDSIRNMRVIDALFRSAAKGGWEPL
jgi:predicted dehydrogenase